MEITRLIGNHADQILPHQLLMSWLKAYKWPNDKILGLKTHGIHELVSLGFVFMSASLSIPLRFSRHDGFIYGCHC